MNNILFTSDLHFSHANICKYTDRKEITSIAEHDNWLVDLWNSQVDKSDTVYVLGDVSFSKIDKTKEIMSKLNGAIFVIKGNHDRREDLDKLKESNLIQHWYEYKEISIDRKDTFGANPPKQTICMFHFPISCWHKQGYGSWHLYGHSHGSFENKGLSLDIGIDSSYNHFGKHKLFTLKDIASIMQNKTFDVQDHHKDNR